MLAQSTSEERQITRSEKNKVLTNTGVWSPDGQWIVYDTRQLDFDGDTIEMVNVKTGEVREIFHSSHGAHCGVATFHPNEAKVVFILGPENPAPDWQYSAYHRQGIIIDALADSGNRPVNLDARDVTPPFTPGALRGGTHVHVWDAAGDWVSFTYEDHVLARFTEPARDHDLNLRNIGVSAPTKPVSVKKDHPRNHDGAYFSVLVTKTTAIPKPGSDEIKKAYEEAWIGTNGYVRNDGTRQPRALAFQGDVVTADNKTITEVFVADLPEDLTQQGDGPLTGTENRMPFPPKGCVQRRLTFTADRRYPGIQGQRHWLRSSPDGQSIAFLMKDNHSTVQLWLISPNGEEPRQLSHNETSVASAFSWSPDGHRIAHVMDNSICTTDVSTGSTRRLTRRAGDASAPQPEACVFSPDGNQIAYLRRVGTVSRSLNQIFVVDAR
jgi:hypothetical protein